MKYFMYGKEEIQYLKDRDVKIGEVIDKTGILQRNLTPDLFSSLVESIIAQQISTKAAETICKRLYTLVEEVKPLKIDALDVTILQTIGISKRKAGYIKSIAHLIATNQFDIKAIELMDDQNAIEKLDTLPGVGVWTAEMLLIFCLNRKNIFSFNDLALKRGLAKLHNHRTISERTFNRYRKLYSPYCSIASLYLWHIS